MPLSTDGRIARLLNTISGIESVVSDNLTASQVQICVGIHRSLEGRGGRYSAARPGTRPSGLNSSGRIPRPIHLGRRTLWSVEELRVWVAAGSPGRDRGSARVVMLPGRLAGHLP